MHETPRRALPDEGPADYVVPACLSNPLHAFDPGDLQIRNGRGRCFPHLPTLRIYGVPFTSSSTPTARCFRSFYDWFSNVIEIVPLALLTSGILSAYQIDEKIRMLLLFLGTVPIFFPLAIKQKESQIRKLRFLTNITVVLQILAIMILGLKNGNYNVISLVASYTFERFFVEEFCYRYSIPYTDLMQYCICFVEVFTVSTLKELQLPFEIQHTVRLYLMLRMSIFEMV